jgi:Flp pilus assembly protein TadD
MKNIKLKNNHNDDKIWLRAANYANKCNWEKAVGLYDGLIKKYPKNTDLLSQAALSYSQFGDQNTAFNIMISLYELKPKDPDVLSNFAVICSKLTLIDHAEQLLKSALEIVPTNIDYILNLSLILNLKNDHLEAIELIKKAIKLDPKYPKSYVLLGTTFSKLGNNKAAMESYLTALTFEPNNLEARFNIATLHSLEENTEFAISEFETILKVSEKNHLNSLPVQSVKYLLSFEYMKSQKFQEACNYYEYGFDKNIQSSGRFPRRHFSKPLWNGDLTPGIRILIWGEQGVGDQIMFMSCMKGIVQSNLKFIVECEPRLISIFSRAFPDFKIRPALVNDDILLSSVSEDYDYHLPMGTLMKHTISKIEDFYNLGPYLKADSTLAIEFENRLSKISNKKRVGISWKSGNLNAERNIHYTNLIDWKVIFETPECEFINLQYGDCEAEIIEVENFFNLKIVRFEDLDLKNDFESTLALISRLDLVITVGTAVSQQAAAIGSPVVLMMQRDWSNFGTDYYPFYENVVTLFPPNGGTVAECLGDAAKILKAI